MQNKEYQRKKAECWEEFCNDSCFCNSYGMTEEAFYSAFDRAYALGKQTEAISQEEIEKAAEEYAKDAYYPAPDYGWYESDYEQVREVLENTFKSGANFALGKQEKDADTVIQGWVARDEVAIRPALYTSKPLRQKKGFENGYWSYGMQIGLSLDPSLFPDLTWNDEPLEVEIIIKRKKK